ncbi:MAG: MotA/TolQ/ExbB proton channel family protein [Spirochaetales bacterium]|nr:MotA/TolQ/ExbB proton channel family protein [Leptospiraceae bacterium]MCP5480865.1 MotA/TolQ/ExbB proton channel family protein [Spirochaetales bacterium]
MIQKSVRLTVLLLLSLLFATAVFAQPPTDGNTPATDPDRVEQSEEQSTPGDENIFEVIYKGGVTMIGLGLISTIIVAFALERFFYMRRQKIDTRGFFEELSRDLEGPGLAQVRKRLDESDLLIARVLTQGLRHADDGERMEKMIESTAAVEIGKMERGLNLLANLGNLAPLLGFFGTVIGMRASFLEFVVNVAPTARDLAGGVEEALITTAAGLLVAIPTFLVYNLFVYFIDNFAMEVERSTALLRQHADSAVRSRSRAKTEK